MILCDVLDFPAHQVAGMLDATEQSVASALKRARATRFYSGVFAWFGLPRTLAD